MTFLHSLLLAAFALGAATSIFWMWRMRWAAERRVSEQSFLVEIGRNADDLAHDLSHLVGLIQLNLFVADVGDPQQQREILEDLKESSTMLYSMFRELRGRRVSDRAVATPERSLRTLAQLVERTGVVVALRVEASLAHGGAPLTFLRLIENLILNAAREATLAGESRVDVFMNESRLEVGNRLRDEPHPREAVVASSPGREGSPGRGLAIARASARAMGHVLSHHVDEDYLVFVVARESSGPLALQGRSPIA